jgi:hypothetical protein
VLNALIKITAKIVNPLLSYTIEHVQLNAQQDIFSIILLRNVLDVLKIVSNVKITVKLALNVPLPIFYTTKFVIKTAQKELTLPMEHVNHAQLDVFHVLLTLV